MKKMTFIFAALLLMVAAACNKQEINKVTDYTGVVVEESAMEPIPNVKVSVTNGARVHTSTRTDENGAFALTVDFDRITTDYFLLLDGSPDLPIAKVELRGMGQKTYDYREVVLYNKNSPSVSTSEVTDVFARSATMGGTVTDAHGFNITERGVCWSTSPYPTIDNESQIMGNGLGDFSATITDLQKETTYYVRAYAINSAGVGYGEEVTFTTLAASSGLFSVSDTKKVYFSLGNLQYQASTNTWRFAEHPWDVVGFEYKTTSGSSGLHFGTVYENGQKCDNRLASSDYSGWIDLFAWGTSGYDHGAVYYKPWEGTNGSEASYSYYYAYGVSYLNLYDQTGTADWGYNPISNGGNEENQWRTLSKEEWEYVLNTRNTPSGLRFVLASVNGTEGTVLLPDNWKTETYPLVSNGNPHYSDNVITANDWADILETEGAVFLPIEGTLSVRYFNSIDAYYNSYAWYWSSSIKDNYGPYYLALGARPSLNTDVSHEMYRCGVRLVHDAQ